MPWIELADRQPLEAFPQAAVRRRKVDHFRVCACEKFALEVTRLAQLLARDSFKKARAYTVLDVPHTCYPNLGAGRAR